MATFPLVHPVEPNFAREVRAGLTKLGQKELPSMYLYDEVGTALFEAITWLPEYGLTRADERLLRMHAEAMIDCLEPPVLVAELGSGTGRKTRYLLEALIRRQPVVYHPIDISRLALAKCRLELAGLGSIGIVGVEQSYLDGLRAVASWRRENERLLILFLGSNIGNFERPAEERFLAEIRRCLSPGDGLLIGMDLEKPVPEMLLAYDDPAGVTAAFNLNLLARVNRELGGDFNLREFAHEARYNQKQRRIEMHLRSLRRQTVSVAAANVACTLLEGETIWTEACHKFRLEEIPLMARRTGFACRAQWVDPQWPFAESLWIAN
ncbi:MAG TPA: L-histidine N(alpha)-methyltransferase [Bryobacterales bacterium]|jgi:L-histidine N-alpha-methyltransferase|nr:L-histidine N(alpha)-methyltransferase [Bryobacterales bacterium]